MKNSLSKKLLCGVLASTFFVVNCQKAPSRAVKPAAKGAAATDAAQKAATDGKSYAECTAEFLSKYSVSAPLVTALRNKIKNENLENLSDSEKSALRTQLSEANDKTELTIAELKKVKADKVETNACKKTSKEKDTKPDIYSVDGDTGISTDFDKILVKIKNVTKDDVVIARTEKAETNVEKKVLNESDLFYVSKEFAESLKSENRGGVVFYKNGQVVTDSGNVLETIKKERSETVCEFKTIDNEATVATDDKFLITQIESPKLDTTNQSRVSILRATVASYAIEFYCSIKKGKELVFKTQIKMAFGSLLKSKAAATADADKAKKEAKEKEDQAAAKVLADTQKEALRIKAEKEAREAAARAAAPRSATASADSTRGVSLDSTRAVVVTQPATSTPVVAEERDIKDELYEQAMRQLYQTARTTTSTPAVRQQQQASARPAQQQPRAAAIPSQQQRVQAPANTPASAVVEDSDTRAERVENLATAAKVQQQVQAPQVAEERDVKDELYEQAMRQIHGLKKPGEVVTRPATSTPAVAEERDVKDELYEQAMRQIHGLKKPGEVVKPAVPARSETLFSDDE